MSKGICSSFFPKAFDLFLSVQIFVVVVVFALFDHFQLLFQLLSVIGTITFSITSIRSDFVKETSVCCQSTATFPNFKTA